MRIPNLTVHDMKPRETFSPEGLYIHGESGAVYCGAHVGTEATYHPESWSCLGRCQTFTHDGVTFRCETPHKGR